ncbi:unnamed protein product [Phytophthora lilii]|uniref:Unnamed protein product n=1 Tax=Phytophthora lilii TaxID=2077276 RepID=A0A9W6WZS3_9STRA|nr:unnamed protein product [Phytophthora lilii]
MDTKASGSHSKGFGAHHFLNRGVQPLIDGDVKRWIETTYYLHGVGAAGLHGDAAVQRQAAGQVRTRPQDLRPQLDGSQDPHVGLRLCRDKASAGRRSAVTMQEVVDEAEDVGTNSPYERHSSAKQIEDDTTDYGTLAIQRDPLLSRGFIVYTVAYLNTAENSTAA